MKGKLEIAIVDAKDAARSFEWGEVVNGFKVYTCHQAQLDILASTAKFTFAFAGSGGGKTCLIPLWLFKQIEKKPDGRFLVVSPTVSTFESSELKRHILETFEGTAYEGEWLDGKKTYRLPTGGEIVVKTVGDGADAQRLRGGQYDAAVADECYLLSAEVWEEVRRRVSNKNGQVLAVTTPDGNNWIYDVKSAADKGDKDYFVRHWSKLDNPTVSKEDVARETILLPEWKRKRMIDGEFSALEGLCYGSFADPKHKDYPVVEVKGNPLEFLSSLSRPVRFFGGNDWGYRPDPAAQLLFAECEDGCMYVVDEVFGTEITPDDLATKAIELAERWVPKADSDYAALLKGGKFVGFYSDTSRPEALQMFRRVGVPIRNKRVDDVLAGIAIVDSWFRAGRLKVFSTCANLIRELRNYQWDTDRRGGFKDKPRGKDDHACDALRYAVSSHKYGVKVTPHVANVLTAEEADEAERTKLKRLGLADDPKARLEELRAQAANRRYQFIANHGLLDD